MDTRQGRVIGREPGELPMTSMEAAATIQRIADSGLDIDTQDYRALIEVAQWLASMSANEIEETSTQEEHI